LFGVRFVRCVRFVGLAGVSGCVNGGLVSVQTRFAFSFSQTDYRAYVSMYVSM